jgi:hypothetical protein
MQKDTKEISDFLLLGYCCTHIEETGTLSVAGVGIGFNASNEEAQIRLDMRMYACRLQSIHVSSLLSVGQIEVFSKW